jgi:hypothetical protein
MPERRKWYEGFCASAQEFIESNGIKGNPQVVKTGGLESIPASWDDLRVSCCLLYVWTDLMIRQRRYRDPNWCIKYRSVDYVHEFALYLLLRPPPSCLTLVQASGFGFFNLNPYFEPLLCRDSTLWFRDFSRPWMRTHVFEETSDSRLTSRIRARCALCDPLYQAFSERYRLPHMG